MSRSSLHCRYFPEARIVTRLGRSVSTFADTCPQPRPREDRQWHETDQLARRDSYQPEELLHVRNSSTSAPLPRCHSSADEPHILVVTI